MAEPLIIEERECLGLASIMARKGVTAAMLGDALGFTITEGPRTSSGGKIMLIGTGPGTWLALHDAESAPDLRARLGSLASLSDQSSSYTLYRLAGAAARTVLQRGAAIDLHPAAFAAGSVAVTAIAHIGGIVWQIDDLPAYDIAVFRSFSSSFRHWLDETVAAL